MKKLLIIPLFLLAACTAQEKQASLDVALVGAKTAANLSPKAKEALEKFNEALKESQEALEVLQTELPP